MISEFRGLHLDLDLDLEGGPGTSSGLLTPPSHLPRHTGIAGTVSHCTYTIFPQTRCGNPASAAKGDALTGPVFLGFQWALCPGPWTTVHNPLLPCACGQVQARGSVGLDVKMSPTDSYGSHGVTRFGGIPCLFTLRKLQNWVLRTPDCRKGKLWAWKPGLFPSDQTPIVSPSPLEIQRLRWFRRKPGFPFYLPYRQFWLHHCLSTKKESLSWCLRLPELWPSWPHPPTSHLPADSHLCPGPGKTRVPLVSSRAHPQNLHPVSPGRMWNGNLFLGSGPLPTPRPVRTIPFSRRPFLAAPNHSCSSAPSATFVTLRIKVTPFQVMLRLNKVL